MNAAIETVGGSEHREQLFDPPPLLQRLVAANLLGRKSGRGLYRYG
jgi:3-hydroxybutyryl-CoA dehydrogenase